MCPHGYVADCGLLLLTSIMREGWAIHQPEKTTVKSDIPSKGICHQVLSTEILFLSLMVGGDWGAGPKPSHP